MADTQAKIILAAEDRTRAAFASVRSGLDGLQSGAAAIAARFAAIGAAITAGLGAIRIASLTDTLDQLDDLSEKSGITVERLSALRFAGETVGTSLEDIAVGARKLAQNMAAAAGGSKEAQAAFDAIGVAVKNVDGSLRSSDQVLIDIADRFAGYRDGAAKAALAQEIFGKSGERLIPLLNRGAEGIRAATKEAEQLGVVFGADLAKKAADLNDNLAKLRLAAEGAAASGLGPLIAKLVEFTDKAIEARKRGTLLSDALKAIATFSPARLIFSDLFPKSSEVDEAEADVLRIRKAIASLEADLQRRPGNQRASENLQRFVADLEQAEAKLARLRSGGAGNARDALRRLEAGVQLPRQQTEAPVVKRPGSNADADKELRQQLAARAQALADGLAKERDALSFHERYLAQVYDASLIDAKTFYDERASAQQQALARQLQLFADEAEALGKARDKAKTPETRTDIDNRLNDLLRERARLEAQAAQAGVLADGERAKALADLQRQLEDYRATLLELRGDEAGAERLRAQRQLDDFNRLSQRAARPQSERDDFAAAVKSAQDLSDARRELARITDEARSKEELYVAQAEAQGAGRSVVERGVYELRQQSIRQLEDLVARTNDLAQASQNPALVAYAEELARQLALARTQIDPATKALYQAADDIGNAFASSFERAIVNGEGLSDVFKAIERDIVAIVTRLLVTQPLAEAIAANIKSIGSGQGGGGIVGFFGDVFKNIFGGGRAAGGPVRGGGLYEVAENGPEVLQMGSRAFLLMGDQGGQVRPAGAGAMGRAVTVNVQVAAPPGGSRETALQFGRTVGQQVQLALRRNA